MIDIEDCRRAMRAMSLDDFLGLDALIALRSREGGREVGILV